MPHPLTKVLADVAMGHLTHESDIEVEGGHLQ